jgi:TonB family protein
MRNSNGTFLNLVFWGTLLIIAVCPPSIWGAAAQDAPKSADEDKIYSKDEVDVKAKIKNIKELDLLRYAKSEESADCENKARVSLRAVLHKTGKVTEVTVVKPMRCGLDEVAVKTVRKAKFTPAVQNGVPVSQYIDIEFQFNRY